MGPMSERKRTRAEILSEMTSLIGKHLDKMPPEERKERIKAFGEIFNRDGKRPNAHPNTSSISHNQRKSQRIPA
jgi:hypothetical protein